jgi:hypothetical protein
MSTCPFGPRKCHMTSFLPTNPHQFSTWRNAETTTALFLLTPTHNDGCRYACCRRRFVQGRNQSGLSAHQSVCFSPRTRPYDPSIARALRWIRPVKKSTHHRDNDNTFRYRCLLIGYIETTGCLSGQDKPGTAWNGNWHECSLLSAMVYPTKRILCSSKSSILWSSIQASLVNTIRVAASLREGDRARKMAFCVSSNSSTQTDACRQEDPRAIPNVWLSPPCNTPCTARGTRHTICFASWRPSWPSTNLVSQPLKHSGRTLRATRGCRRCQFDEQHVEKPFHGSLNSSTHMAACHQGACPTTASTKWLAPWNTSCTSSRTRHTACSWSWRRA